MKYAIRNLFALGAVFGGTALAFQGFPQADRIEPRVARIGAVLTVWGRALDKDHVEEVYLTDHRFDMKVKVIEQSDTFLKFRIPPFAKPGRLQLLLLTGGEKPAYLEQPLYVQVDEHDAPEVPTAPQVTRKGKTKAIEIASVGRSIPVPSSPPVNREEPPVQQQPVVVPSAVPAVVPAPVPASPPPAATSQAISKGITPPRLIKKTPVAIPALSSSLGSDNTVELSVRIRVDGKIGSVNVLRGNPILAQVAIRSVRDWIYESAYLGSTPVEADVTVLLNFKR